MPNTTSRPDPEAIFNAKLPTLRRMVNFHCMRRGLARHEEDLQGFAALRLWEECRRLAGRDVEISCEAIKAGVFAAYFRRKRPALLTDVTPDDLPAHEPMAREPAIGRGFTRYTLVDAMLDDPAGVELYETGLTPAETAARLGVTRQRVEQLGRQGRLGARAFPAPGKRGQVWRFPRTVKTSDQRRKVATG